MATNDLRRALKSAAAGVLKYSGLRTAMGVVRRTQAGGRRVLIVGYHRVVEDYTGELRRCIPGTLISKETFQRHLEEAHALGYQMATMDEAVEVLAGRKRAKQDLFVVTFDDGYRDVYRTAYPILQRMGVPAMVYLATELIGTDKRFNHDRLFHLIELVRKHQFRPVYEALPPQAAVLLHPIFTLKKTPSESLDDFIGLFPTSVLTDILEGLERQLGGMGDLLPESGDVMSWAEARTMAANGVDFGAHTLSHCVLTLEPAAEVDRQIGESKRIIEAELLKPVRDFAYCNGWYSDEVIRALVRHGFRSAVTTEDLLNRIGGDPFALKRKVLGENFSRGINGDYSSSLTGLHFEDIFGLFNVHHPVVGKRPQLPFVLPLKESLERAK